MIRSLKYGVNEIKYFLRIFVTPHCWIRNHRTNSHWDKFIRQNLINPEFTRATGYTIELNGTSIWIGNYPYASYSNNNVANNFPGFLSKGIVIN